MVNKKSMIQISMSWLFMIIIGTFFIVFAYNVIGKYQDIETQKNELNLQNSLRNILNNIGRTAGTESNSIQNIGNIFQDSKVEVLCFQNISMLSINGRIDSNNDYLKTNPVFMTNIKQNKIASTYLAVESFKMPFKISNLLAIISKRNLLVFDKQSKISKDILEKFKRGSYEDLTVDSVDLSNIDSRVSDYNSKNLNSIMFVLDKSRKDDFLNKKDILKKLNAPSYIVLINKSTDITGTIQYIYLDSNEDLKKSQVFEYIDYAKTLALPTMAIFSSPQTFECSYNLLAKQVKPIYKFYDEKIKYFLNYLNTGKSLCSKTYHIFQQKELYNSTNVTLNKFLNFDFDSQRFKYSNNQILNNLKELESEQKKVEKDSCSYIY